MARSGTRAGAELEVRVFVYRAISMLRRSIQKWEKFKLARAERALHLLANEPAIFSRA